MALSAVPRLSGRPVVGNLFDLQHDRLTLFQRVVRECGDTGELRAGRRRLIFFNAPEDVYAVLVEQAAAFEKGPGLRRFSRPLLGNGLLTSDNEFHRRQRKLVAPAFQPHRLAGYAAIMARVAAETADSWQDGSVVDLAAEMMRLTLAVSGHALFGVDVTAEAAEIGAAVTLAVQHAARLITSPLPLPLGWPTPSNLRTRTAIRRLDETVYRIIQQRRKSGEDAGDFLSILLSAADEDDGARMTDRQIRDEVMTLFLASHETTANALSWTWYLLARHPDAYEKLCAEARDTLNGRLPDYADAARLPYALQVFKESLRLYPPAYAIGRQATRDVVIGKAAVPAGTIVLVSPFTLHRRAENFPDPEQFRPERFALSAERSLPRGSFLPFGAGPRNCIGSLFALLEGQIVLALLAQRVRFDLVSGEPAATEPMITLRPKSGIPAVVRRTAPLH